MWKCVLEWIEAHPGMASWVQAVVSIGAVAIAIYVPWQQHRNDVSRHRATEAEKRRMLRTRLVAAIRADVAAIDQILDSRIEVARKTKLEIETAAQAGEHIGGGQVGDAHRLSDRVIYTAVAQDLGELPSSVLNEIIDFYNAVGQMEYTGGLCSDVSKLLDLQINMGPRVRARALMLVEKLKKFSAGGYRDDVDLRLTREQIIGAAKAAGYPLEEIAAQRTTAPGNPA